MTKNEENFIPVTISANLGSYSIGRAFHEKYGLKTELLCAAVVFPILNSELFNIHLDKTLHYESREAVRRYKKTLDEKYPDKKKLFIASDDYSIGYITKNLDLFDDNWIIPFIDYETYRSVADKTPFYELCARLNVSHPKSWILTKDSDFPEDATGKLVVKPAFNDYFEASLKSDIDKIYFLNNAAEAKEVVSEVRKEGYHATLVLQQFIEGSDTDQAVVTAYRGVHDKEVKFISFGRILIEDKSPKKAGNHLTIMTEKVPEQVRADIEKILEETDYVGFANFDLIYDYNTNQWNFFELNARAGYSNYQVTAHGYNIAEVYVEDAIHNRLKKRESQEDIIYTVLPIHLNIEELSGNYLEKFKAFKKNKRVFNPVNYSGDNSLKRKIELFKARRRTIREYKEGR